MILAGCGATTSKVTQPPPPPPALSDYTECMSTTPIDTGDANEPVITLRGPATVGIPLGTNYVDAGATAIDPKDGDISASIVVTGLTSDLGKSYGDYLIRYNVTDGAKLRAREAVRVVRVGDVTFEKQTGRDIGTTAAHMGYWEHLPVHYADDPNQKFPLLIFIHGWGRARFLDPYTEQAPLLAANANIASLIQDGRWDDTRPFIVLSPQKCVDALTYYESAGRMKLFIDYAINTYKVDTARIYMGGHSQGSGDTWDYVVNYPFQLAAIFPIAGGYGTQSGCALKNTPAWAFAGELDTPVNSDQIDTVASINACDPPERAKVTILQGADHDGSDVEVLTLSGVGLGMAPYDIYNQSIYDWLLAHQRKP
jgi:predicted esterase